MKNVEDKVDNLKHLDLVAQIAEAGINPDNILGWSNTKLAVDQVANPIQEVRDELRTKDTERELHSNASSVKEKVRHPLFEGREETNVKKTPRR